LRCAGFSPWFFLSVRDHEQALELRLHFLSVLTFRGAGAVAQPAGERIRSLPIVAYLPRHPHDELHARCAPRGVALQRLQIAASELFGQHGSIFHGHAGSLADVGGHRVGRIGPAGLRAPRSTSAMRISSTSVVITPSSEASVAKYPPHSLVGELFEHPAEGVDIRDGRRLVMGRV
jgi:hypothetical protein